jgi:hypothetical protein
VSNHSSLTLHQSEESIILEIAELLIAFPGPTPLNPISEYFSKSSGLAAKLVTTPYSDDSEILGLLLLGVVSAAEFYFRRVLGQTITICPVCRQHAEMLQVPIAAFDFFSGSGYSNALGSFEHESLADAAKIRAKCKIFTGLDVSSDPSADQAIKGFDLLCELRHCLVHSSGFAGLKACRALGVEQRSLQKIIVGKKEVFELLKLSHNAVRAFNRFLVNSIINRWIDEEVLSGEWKVDKYNFNRVIESFWIVDENVYGGIAWNAYRSIRPSILARNRAMAAKVAPIKI